jgi:hypothetical protein
LFIRLALAAFLAMSVLGGCSVAPVQEMSNARQAVQAAVDSGAGDEAPDDLAAARRYLRQAEDALRQGHYAEARHRAIQARRRAQDALEVTRTHSDDANSTPSGNAGE